MRALVMTGVACGLIAGCSGLEMHTLQTTEVAAARMPNGVRLNGYVVYEPVVVVELSDVCQGPKDDAGACKDRAMLKCSVGAPFYLPDYERPYLVASKSGLGQAGVDVTIVNGWMLGNVKDSSDNTAVLAALTSGLGVAKQGVNVAAASSGLTPGTPKTCKAAGLYRVQLGKGGVDLVELKLY